MVLYHAHYVFVHVGEGGVGGGVGFSSDGVSNVFDVAGVGVYPVGGVFLETVFWDGGEVEELCRVGAYHACPRVGGRRAVWFTTLDKGLGNRPRVGGGLLGGGGRH